MQYASTIGNSHDDKGITQMNKATLALGIGLVLLAAATAGAEEEKSVYSRPGPYAAVGGTVAWAVTDGSLSEVDTGESLGVNARLGYRVLPWLAVEGEYEYLDEFNHEAAPKDFTGFAAGGNVKWFPVDGVFQPYALVGVSYYEIDFPTTVTKGEVGVRFGGGMDCYIDEHIYFNAGLDYMLGTGGLEDFDYVALQFGFGYRM